MTRKHLLRMTTLWAMFFMVTQAFAMGRIYYAGTYSAPYIWAWTGNTNVYAAWPGQAMTLLPDQTYYGRPVFYIDIEDQNHNCPDSVIFNDNGGAGRPQCSARRLYR